MQPTKPQFAYRLPKGEIGWNLSTRPREPCGEADQTLSMSFDEDRVDVIFEAQLSVTSGYVFQHRLIAPKALKIDGVSVVEGETEQARRWTQDDDGSIDVFLNGPALKPQKLVLRGQLPILLGEKSPLPPVRMEKCQIHSAAIRLFQRPDVQLTIDGVEKQKGKNQPVQDYYETSLGRLVETIAWDGSQALPNLIAVKAVPPKNPSKMIKRPIPAGQTFCLPWTGKNPSPARPLRWIGLPGTSELFVWPTSRWHGREGEDTAGRPCSTSNRAMPPNAPCVCQTAAISCRHRSKAWRPRPRRSATAFGAWPWTPLGRPIWDKPKSGRQLNCHPSPRLNCHPNARNPCRRGSR